MAFIHILAVEANRSGGAGVYTAQLARRLAERQHRVALICYDSEPELEAVCEVQRLPRPGFGQWPVVWRLDSLLQQRACNRNLAALRLGEPDCIIGSAQQLTWPHARR